MKDFKRVVLFLLLLSFEGLWGAKLPELTSEDVRETLHKMMEEHVTYKSLSPNLVQRALKQYIDDLDPTKTYFLKGEIEQWLSPTKERVTAIAEEAQLGSYCAFQAIHEAMVIAISRRNHLEEKIAALPLPKDVTLKEFKELDWSQSEEGLTTRLLRLKALQSETTQKLASESKEKALLRIKKRRLSREDEIAHEDSETRAKGICSRILKAFAASLDAHTAYFTPGEAAQFMIQVQQRLFGIGVQLRDDLNGFTIMRILDGGPASRNKGLKAGDKIIAIDDEPVVGMEITDAVDLIRGEEGTSMIITLIREVPETQDEEKLDIEITRGEVVIQEARLDSKVIPFGEGIIAHISLHAFYQDPLHSSAGDLYEEISKLKRIHKVKGILLDLRNNSGGVLPQAVAVTGLFITKGIVVSIKDNTGDVEHLRDIDGKTIWDGPLIILTSKASASAAEIVAQTLQDYGRAIVVGDAHTYGKGTFQTFTLDTSNIGKLNPKGEFKVTRGRYYTVSGKSPQLVGVTPDIEVPGSYSAMEIGERYAKFPLENDAIPENFNDDLSDIPPVQRDQISWLYRFNLQTRIKMFTRHLPILKKNSHLRIENDSFYQSFLEVLKEDDPPLAIIEVYGHEDLQLKEATNIMKDLALLLHH